MSSEILLIVIAVAMVAAVVLVAAGVLASKSRTVTEGMDQRLERYGHIADTITVEHEDRDAQSFMAGQLDRAVKGRSFSERTRTALARADLRMTVGEWLLVRSVGATGGFLVGMVMGRTSLGLALFFGVLLAAGGWMVPQLYLNVRTNRRRKAFVNQLGDTIAMMANSLRAGYSLLQTMELVARESPSPMSEEFGRVVREVGLGIATYDALDNLLRRIPSEDLDLLVSAIKIQHEVGGNLGQILDVIGETIRERVRIQGEIRTLTAQQSLSGYVISALPVGLGAILFLINPDFMMQMLVWPYICMPIGALILEVIGFFAMRKIVAIEV